MVRDRGDLAALPAAERDVVDYARQLVRSNAVAPVLFDRLQGRHGVPWLVELTCLIGHYGIVASILNAFEVAPSPEAEALPLASGQKGNMMLLTERRKLYRRVLDGSVCVHPASVFDAMSARMAESLGFEIGMFAGSIASATVLGAPDLVVLTLTEFAEQIRRIARGSDLPLMVDADHGYGNALNVMRTVEELETSGVAALTIEDTVLPSPFGGQRESLVSVEEMLGKLRGAVAARQDPSLVVIGRTPPFARAASPKRRSASARIRRPAIDAIFLAGASTREEVEALHRVTRLPLILGGAPPALSDRAYLASQGVRIALQGHQPFYAAAKAVYDTLEVSARGRRARGPQGPRRLGRAADVALNQNEYKRRQATYLR